MDEKKTVIVSGGTYGVGRAIVVELAARGWRVVAFGLEARQPGSAAQAGIADTRAALGARGLAAELLEADVADEADVARVVAAAGPGLAGLVNNAAIRPSGTILETDPAMFERVLRVNLVGPYLLARAALPLMIAAGGGTIVNIGSGAAWGKPGIAAYGAAKAGLAGLSAAMAYDHLAERIRVNQVVPGPGTASGMVEAMAGQGRAPARTVTGRPTAPADVARAVAFLLSDDAAQISGTVLDVGCFAGQGGVGQPRA